MATFTYEEVTRAILNDFNTNITEISNRSFWESDINYDSGASKFTILNNRLGDKVVKIPFAESDEDEYCDASYRFAQDCDGNCFCCPFNKGCGMEDYCDKEVEVYNAAVRAGLGFLFAKTELLYSEDGTSCYIQDRVTYSSCHKMYSEDEDTYLSNYLCSKFEDTAGYRDHQYWAENSFVMAVARYYGEDVALDLIYFLYNQDLNDFHSGNWGYDEKERPVVFDYSGFHG